MAYQDKPELDYLMHYGVKRRSGRYPWGSGDNPYQHSGDFLSRVEELRKEGFSFTDENGKTYTGDTAIAKYMGLSTTEYRAYVAVARTERRSLEVATAKSMRADGYTLKEIADKLGYANDSSVRALLNEDAENRMNLAQNKANEIKNLVDQKGFIDVGVGTEKELGISKEKMNEALLMLEAEGYKVYGVGIPQVNNPGKQTTTMVVCPPGTAYEEVYDFSKIHSLTDYISRDDGVTFEPSFRYPSSMDSSRLKICYADEKGMDGHLGIEKDGVIELRRGVADLDLGNSNYAQVRIMVDGTHYMKGMAVYSDNMPDGVDVVFNTNKKSDVPMHEVLKKIKNDPDNPFGSLIKEHGGQSYYDDPNGEYTDPVTGKKQSLSLINKRADEGDWGEWSKSLSSQFLSKQSQKLIDRQLDISMKDRQAEFDEICSLTNPTVKKELLRSFADECDSAAVKLDAAALPRQKYQVILPLPGLKENQVYAPNYEDGETVALIRYPHGGTFEIPILKVNNKSADGKRILGTSPLDAIGINPKVAERLSGADFDGDTVMVIPCNSDRSDVRITSTPPLKGLEGFDSKQYKYDKKTVDEEGNEHYYRNGREFRTMTKSYTQTQMGVVSNLITDMTLRGASQDELARAVRHSMVVIDAEKHKLDYKQSEVDNDIPSLKKRYQGYYDEDGKYRTGASTLISRAGAQQHVNKRVGSAKIDPETGEKTYKSVEETYVDKNGKTVTRTIKSTQMAETKDARLLSSGTPQEEAYATYANKMKSLANEARKELISTGNLKRNPSAAQTYSAEVARLKAALNIAEKNAPRERHAQTMANAIVAAKQKEYPDMTKKEIKKEKQRALTNARIQVGAHRELITISDREWEAIQAGAISENTLVRILRNTDVDSLRQRATPKPTTTISSSQQNTIQAMKAKGYTNAEIAERVGVSASTVNRYLLGEE